MFTQMLSTSQARKMLGAVQEDCLKKEAEYEETYSLLPYLPRFPGPTFCDEENKTKKSCGLFLYGKMASRTILTKHLT